MGYDEPSSKRSAAIYGDTAVKVKPNPWPRRVLLAILVLGVGGYLAINPDTLQQLSALSGASSQRAAGRGAGRGVAAAAPVRVAIAETRDVGMEARTLGTVLANSVVTVKSQIDGPLLAAGFKEGQMVKKGDLLFTIDPAPFTAALRQSEAQVARDQAQLASAQADADRAVMLADRGIVSAQQRDQLVANAKALAATVQADEAAADRARLNLGYTTLRSPVNGKTGPYLVFPGNQVHASDAAGLVTIAEIQPVKITFNLPQGDLPQLQDRLREGTLIAAVMARSDVAGAPTTDAPSGTDKEIPVKVDFIGNAVDDRTGTIELRATFDNPDLRLVPGELVDVGIRLQTLKQAVAVPREAVNVGQNGNYVFVVDDSMKSQMRPVTVLYQDQFIAALGSGVKAGDRVVTDGQLRLTPGSQVTITQAAPVAVPAQTAPQASADRRSEATISKAAGSQAAAPAGGGQDRASRRGG
jgi:multidrug efflux system membrane fusion protein